MEHDCIQEVLANYNILKCSNLNTLRDCVLSFREINV